MKEYITRRIEELKKEKEMWLSKLTMQDEETYRIEYLTTLKVLDELYSIAIELEKIGE